MELKHLSAVMLTLTGFLPIICHGQSPNKENDRVYIVKRIAKDRVIVIDGVRKKTEWDGAVLLTQFAFPWTKASAPPTRFRALHNGKNLYFVFEVVDPDLVLNKTGDNRERVIGSDRVELFFTTSDTLEPYYCFEIDPRGKVYDYKARFYRHMDGTWQCAGLKVATVQDDSGYVVEGMVPLGTLRKLECVHNTASGQVLKAGIFRAEFHHGPADNVIKDWISWINPKTEQPDFHVPTSFGIMLLDAMSLK